MAGKIPSQLRAPFLDLLIQSGHAPEPIRTLKEDAPTGSWLPQTFNIYFFCWFRTPTLKVCGNQDPVRAPPLGVPIGSGECLEWIKRSKKSALCWDGLQ